MGAGRQTCRGCEVSDTCAAWHTGSRDCARGRSRCGERARGSDGTCKRTSANVTGTGNTGASRACRARCGECSRGLPPCSRSRARSRRAA